MSRRDAENEPERRSQREGARERVSKRGPVRERCGTGEGKSML